MSRKVCPLIRKRCLEQECEWWIQIQGQHPQTGEKISQHDCTFKWLPLLLMEGSQQTRQAAGAIESFRNEMVKASEAEQVLKARELQVAQQLLNREQIRLNGQPLFPNFVASPHAAIGHDLQNSD